MTGTELLPCPFCGWPASHTGAAVRCNNFACNTTMTPRWTKDVVGSAKGDPDVRFALAKADCTRRWNQRGEPAPGIAEDLSQAARDVLAERQRQISAEGWTPEHDDQHDRREMAKAAVCYVLWGAGNANGAAEHHPGMPSVPGWPWDESWWKPTTPRRDLVKAAALMLAEIDRLDRQALSNMEGQADG